MCFRFLSVLLALALPLSGAEARELRVCADPNNLPFSNDRQEGFENRLAELLARDLGARLTYTWWVERKSLVKNTLDAGKCDVLLGLPSMMTEALATAPYYRSTYVFVSRRDGAVNITSLNDPALGKLRIGIHVVDNDYAPPARALARQGLAANMVGYSLFGAFGEPNPPSRLVEAVAKGDVDLAIVWGPFAGYFGKRQSVPLRITPVSPAMFLAVPFTYSISVAVRKNNVALRDKLDAVLHRECSAIGRLLNEYGVPVVAPEEEKDRCDAPRESPSASLR